MKRIPKISMSRRHLLRTRALSNNQANRSTDKKTDDQTEFDRERIRVWDWESTGAGARDDGAGV